MPRSENTRFKYVYDKNTLCSKSCVLIKSVYDYFCLEKAKDAFALDPFKLHHRLELATGISRRTISKILREKDMTEETNSGKVVFETPSRHKYHSKLVCNCFTLDVIRQRIYSKYRQVEIPSVFNLIKELHDEGIIKFKSQHRFRSLLHSNGFRFQLYSGRKVLMEKHEVGIKRCHFFKKMQRVNYNDIVWIGETSFITPFRLSPSERKHKIIVLHAGTSKGFIEGALSVFTSRDTSDSFHKEISPEYFHQWLVKLMNSIPEGSSLVLSHTPCHNANVNKPPNIFSTKQIIRKWLDKNNVPYSDDYHKAELLSLVNLSKPILSSYDVDRTVVDKGFSILRLPPYHNHYNAMELIYNDIKKDVDSRISQSRCHVKGDDLERMIHEAIDSVSPSEWETAVQTTRLTIIQATAYERELESHIESLFKRIDSIKRSGKEELATTTRNYRSDNSDNSDYFSDATVCDESEIASEELIGDNTCQEELT